MAPVRLGFRCHGEVEQEMGIWSDLAAVACGRTGKGLRKQVRRAAAAMTQGSPKGADG